MGTTRSVEIALRLRRPLRLARRPTVRGVLRRVSDLIGERPRLAAAGALLQLPAGNRGRGRLSALLAGIRVATLSAAGRGSDAHDFAVQRGAVAGAWPRLAMAGWLSDHGAADEALAIIRDPLPVNEATALRRRWQLLHATTARRLGRYAEARTALAVILNEDPEDAIALAETRRLEQIIERYTTVPVVERAAPIGMRRTPGRVLHLVDVSLADHRSRHGARTHQVALAQRRSGLSPRVLVVGSRPPDGSLRHHVDGVDYEWLPGAAGMRRLSEASWTELANRAADVVREFEPVALYAVTPPTVGNLGRALAGWSGLPLLYEVRDFRDQRPGASHGGEAPIDDAVLSRRADSICMFDAAAVITTGGRMSAEVLGRGVPAEKVSVVPGAVDTARFRPGPRDQPLAARYGIGPNEVVIGSISGFGADEDLITLVNAIGILRAHGRPVRGLLVGDGPMHVAIERLVADLRLGSIVVLPGKVPRADVPRHHRLIDTFVFSRVQGAGAQVDASRRPLEAMASGRSVVVSRVDALTETVIDGQTGVTFRPGGAADLASVLERLVLDPLERSRLGEQARAWVGRERTLDRNGQRFVELYAQLGVPLR